MTFSVRTDSAEGTRRVGATLAGALRPGDLLILSGDLGGGKTTFVQGLARGLGIEARVTSPTFTLAHTYEGHLRLHHLDAYRLETDGETLDLNLPELLIDTAVTVVEWGERIVAEVPPDYLRIGFSLVISGAPDTRRLDVEPVGPSWLERCGPMAAAIRSLGPV